MKPNSALRKFVTVCRWACLIVGVAFLLITIVFTAHTALFLHRSISAPGIVLGLTQQNGSDGTVSYAPIFTFKAQSGLSYTITSAVASNPPSFAPGQQVRVLYEESKPQEARIGAFWQLWFVQFIFGVFGIAAILASYIISRVQSRSRTSSVENHGSSGFAA